MREGSYRVHLPMVDANLSCQILHYVRMFSVVATR